MNKFKLLNDGLIVNKISKTYGNKKVVRDIDGNECVLSSLYSGNRILPKGSISQVLLDNDGLFVKRSSLVGFNSWNLSS